MYTWDEKLKNMRRKQYKTEKELKYRSEGDKLKEALKITDRFKNDYGIVIDAGVWDLDNEPVIESLHGIECVIREFPNTKDSFKAISIKSGGIMNAGYDGSINFNPIVYKTRESVLYNHGLDDASIVNLIHPKGNNAFGTGCHEAGHILEKALCDLINGGESVISNSQWNDGFLLKALLMML